MLTNLNILKITEEIRGSGEILEGMFLTLYQLLSLTDTGAI